MKIRNGYKIRNIAGENVIVSIGKLNVNLTKIISLNETSVWLWEQIGSNDFNAETIANMLTDHYGIDRDTALADAKAWIDSLIKAELIEP